MIKSLWILTRNKYTIRYLVYNCVVSKIWFFIFIWSIKFSTTFICIGYVCTIPLHGAYWQCWVEASAIFWSSIGYPITNRSSETFVSWPNTSVPGFSKVKPMWSGATYAHLCITVVRAQTYGLTCLSYYTYATYGF